MLQSEGTIKLEPVWFIVKKVSIFLEFLEDKIIKI